MPLCFRLAICLCSVVAVSASAQALSESPCGVVPQIAAEVAQIRGLDQLRSIKCEELSPKDFISRAASLREVHGDDSFLELEDAAYKALGIIPNEYPYARCMSGDIDDTAAAFYDHRSRALVFRKDVQVAFAIIAHEVVHALQDQHFNISRMLSRTLSTDADLATSAVREGDAMVVERRFERIHPQRSTAGAQLLGDGFRAGCSPPPLLEDVLLFPYEWGLLLLKNSSAEARNNLIKNPPMSTRELFYGNEAVHQSTPKKGGSFFSDSLGEFILRRLLMRTGVRKEQAILAAKGLTLDTLTVRRSKHRLFIEWQMRFESIDERQEAQPLLVKLIEQISNEKIRSGVSEVWLEDERGQTRLRCKGSLCVLSRFL